jgi:hypothetical protein
MNVKKELGPWIPWMFGKLKPNMDILLRAEQLGLTEAGMPGKAIAPPNVVKNPQYSENQYMQLVSMMAAIINYGLSEFKVIEQCGRVYLVSFAPLRHDDPVLPVVFRDYGRVYRRNYHSLVNMLIDMPVWGWDYHHAKKYADELRLYVAGDRELTWHEVSYYEHWLYYTIAMPEKAI